MLVLNHLGRNAAACAALSLVLAGAPQLAAAQGYQASQDYQSNPDYRDAPPPNAAQGSSYDDQQAYQDCQSHKTNNAVAGAVVGGVLGAVVGSSIAGRGSRTPGAVIGGGGGAIAGAAIGSGSTNCSPPPVDANNQGGDYGPGYAQDDRGYRDDGRYYRQGTPPDPGPGCDWADSTVYMPDGTTQKHLVHVCRDARGYYQIVN